MDMGTSDEDDEDGQINKSEQDGEKERKPVKDEQPITMDDLEKCHLTRAMIAKYYLSPWFEEYVKSGYSNSATPFLGLIAADTWVRYLIGSEDGKNIYRICQVISTLNIRVLASCPFILPRRPRS